MKQLRTLTLIVAVSCMVGGVTHAVLTPQSKTEQYWQKQLAKARGALAKNPKSSFWHGQAGVAYDGLGDVSKAEEELKLAAKLAPTNPMDQYVLYAFYQRRGTLSQQRRALLDALDIDWGNPLGHYALGTVLEKEEYLEDALREYGTAKQLVQGIKANEYIDSRGNPYDISVVRRDVSGAMDRVKLEQVEKKRDR